MGRSEWRGKFSSKILRVHESKGDGFDESSCMKTRWFLLLAIVFLPVMWAVVVFWRKPFQRPLLLYFFCMGAPIFLIYFLLTFHSRVLPNWIAPSILPFFCLGVVYWEERWRNGFRPIGGWLAAGLVFGLTSVVILHDTNLVPKLTGGWNFWWSYAPTNIMVRPGDLETPPATAQLAAYRKSLAQVRNLLDGKLLDGKPRDPEKPIDLKPLAETAPSAPPAAERVPPAPAGRQSVAAPVRSAQSTPPGELADRESPVIRNRSGSSKLSAGNVAGRFHRLTERL